MDKRWFLISNMNEWVKQKPTQIHTVSYIFKKGKQNKKIIKENIYSGKMKIYECNRINDDDDDKCILYRHKNIEMNGKLTIFVRMLMMIKKKWWSN